MELNENLIIKRYPTTQDKSLQAWNAADELILGYVKEHNEQLNHLVIYHDKFGYLTCYLNQFQPVIVINYKSQQKSIERNIIQNGLVLDNLELISPLDQFAKKTYKVLIKIPKSVDLFELYLRQLIPFLNEKSEVICGFMTRYFSQHALKIAQNYFEEVQQSKAKKKARLMILKRPKKLKDKNLIKELKLNEKTTLKQYSGVFSAAKIDIATQFLMDHLQIRSQHHQILDLGCGNGILAHRAYELNPSANIHLTDDNFLAIASAKLNLPSSFHYYFTNNLEVFNDGDFDLVISNPPFHFEYENNIEITLDLFKEVFRVLKVKGEFQLVANLHLNYKVHLVKYFSEVEILAQNNKFIVYRCIK